MKDPGVRVTDNEQVTVQGRGKCSLWTRERPSCWQWFWGHNWPFPPEMRSLPKTKTWDILEHSGHHWKARQSAWRPAWTERHASGPRLWDGSWDKGLILREKEMPGFHTNFQWPETARRDQEVCGRRGQDSDSLCCLSSPLRLPTGFLNCFKTWSQGCTTFFNTGNEWLLFFFETPHWYSVIP